LSSVAEAAVEDQVIVLVVVLVDMQQVLNQSLVH